MKKDLFLLLATAFLALPMSAFADGRIYEADQKSVYKAVLRAFQDLGCSI